MRKPKIYLDTSVIGGCFDKEFDVLSTLLFDEFKSGKAVAVISSITLAELEMAPEYVRNAIKCLPEDSKEFVELDDDCVNLAADYISDGVVGNGSLADAQQVAIASLNKVDIIASWNFKHIVNLNRIRLFAATNLKHGLQTPEIRSPKEILSNDEEDD